MARSSLNHVYRLIWNAVLHQWVVVSEITKGKGKSKSQKAAAVVASALFATASWAGPEGGVVTSGSGTISQNGAITTINQTSQTLNLNWNTFNVAAHETVNFIQPSATALAINQILDTNGSRILGNINANGQVWLINPNGVLFGQGAQINVGSILASTLNPLSELDSEEQKFGKGGKGSVVNQGTIKAADGGYVAMIANQVSNLGTIVANKGTVALAAGSQVTLSFADNQLYKVNVDQSTFNNLAENKQLIQANGGAVFLSAGAKDSLMKSVVNNEGIIEAQTIENKEGKIVLLAGMSAGTTNVAGTLDASAQTGDGGFIETSGAKVKVADTAKITTKAKNGSNGQWLIDPYDFFIAASGGDITGAALNTALQSNNVTIQTLDSSIICTGASCGTGTSAGNGDIFVNDVISWTSDNSLTLNAYRNININRSITATGATAKLNLYYGQGAIALNNSATYNVNARVNLQAGDNFSTKLGSDGIITEYKVITSLGNEASSNDGTLQGIRGGLNGNYVLGADIDAIGTATWNSGDGFTPIGELPSSPGFNQAFSGRFDGLGHVIKNLTIDRSTENADGPAPNSDTGLFGYTSTTALIQNVGLFSANIKGDSFVGGLVGTNLGKIYGSFVTGVVEGDFKIGGLVGDNGGEIKNSYFKGEVKAVNDVGGLVGRNALMDISETPLRGLIENSYADSTITMLPFSTSSGEVTSPNKGGLVGFNGIATSFDPDTGEPTTFEYGTVTNSFWRSTSTGFNNALGMQVDTELQTLSTFTNAGWNISNIGGDGKTWRIYAGRTAPLLRSFMTYTDLGVATVTYNGNPQNPTPTILPSLDANLWNGTAASGTNAGTYNNSDYYSSQLGYDFDRGSLVITPRLVNVTASALDKVYNGSAAATASLSTSDFITSDLPNINLSFGGATFASPNVAYDSSNNVADQNVTVTGISLGGNATVTGNYSLSSTSATATAKITPKPVNVTASALDKVYNGSATATATLSTTDFLAADQSNFSFIYTGATFASPNVAYDSSNNVADQNVAVTGIALNGTNATVTGNYSLSSTSATTTAKITPKPVNVTASALDKVYNGSSAATASLSTSDFITSDLPNINLSFSGATFASPNVAYDSSNNVADQNVAVTGIALNGTNATVTGNYSLSSTSATTTAKITPKPVNVTASALDKVYNGSSAATASLSTSDFITSDLPNINLSFSGATFASPNVAYDLSNNVADQNVAVTGIALNGTNATVTGNYSLSSTSATTTAKITPIVLNLSGSRIYDGTGIIADGVLGIVSGQLIGTETLGLSGSGTVTNRNASSTPQNLATNTYILSNGNGPNAGLASNYTLVGGSKTVVINRANATVTANSKTVAYNGSEQFVDGYTVVGLVDGDNINDFNFYTVEGTGVGTNPGVYDHEVSLSLIEGPLNYDFEYIDGKLTIEKTNTDLTNPITNTRNPASPPPPLPNNTPPLTIKLDVPPESSEDVLYDIIETFGCSV